MDAVLNWLWQGAALAVSTAALLRITTSSTAGARYLALWVALAAVLALPAVPFVWASAPASAVSLAGELPSVDAVVSVRPGWWTSTTVLIALWAIWFTVQAGRVGCGVLALRGVRRRTRPLPPHLEARLHCWTAIRGRGRHSRLVLSDEVRSAAVLGCGAPVIALAPAVVRQLSADDLDGVVVHEWAHVQRRDDLVNVCHVGIRMVAGWHPAVWWLERQLQIERELACDDIVVRVTGAAREFAACLARLAALPRPPLRARPALAVSTSGLRRRLLHLLSAHEPARQRTARWTPAFVGAVVCGLAATIGGVRLIERAAAVPLLEAAVGTVQWSALNASVGRTLGPIDPAPAQLAIARGRPPRSREVSTPDRMDILTEGDEAVLPFPAFMPSPTGSVADESASEAVTASPTVSLAAWDALTIAPPRIRGGSHTAAAPAPDHVPATPWAAAADGGVAVARSSQRAAVATAGFFGRLGKTLAAAF